MAFIRFVSPTVPDLDISGVPVTFANYIADIDEDDTARLEKIRFLGQPYGVIELGVTTNPFPWPTTEFIAAQMADPASVIGSALREAVGATEEIDLSTLEEAIDNLRYDVDQLKNSPGGGSGGGVGWGDELPTELDTGALFARRRTY